MPAFSVRPAVPEDADAITEVWVQSWLDTYLAPELGITEDYIAARLTRRSSAAGREHLRQRIARGHGPDAALFVAEADGRIIGLAGPRRDDDGLQHVGALYVDRAWHGRGPGAALMAEILKWRDPTRPLALSVAAYNARARAFYAKWGFAEIPGSETFEGLIPVVRMELDARRLPTPPARRRRPRRFPWSKR